MNANAAPARALMQQGLRNCKGSRELWLEYFRMELLYCLRLRARRQVLGIDDPAGERAQADAFLVHFVLAATNLQRTMQFHNLKQCLVVNLVSLHYLCCGGLLPRWFEFPCVKS